MKTKWIQTLDDTPIQIIWWSGVAAIVPNTLYPYPPMDPSCSTPPPTASPTATLYTTFVEEFFSGAPL